MSYYGKKLNPKFKTSSTTNSYQKQMNSNKKTYDSLVNGGYGAWASKQGLQDYTARLQGMLTNIQNSKFNYDAQGDGAYQAYKNQYQGQAQMAQKNAIGQASAASGFASSSYAQSAGNDAFQQQMNNLSSIQSDLMNLAYQKYSNDQSNKQNMYNIYNQQNQQQYSQYSDAVNNAFNNLNYATDAYTNSYNNDYTKYSSDRNYNQNMFTYYGNTVQGEKDRAQSQAIADRDYKQQKNYYNSLIFKNLFG